MCSFVDIFIIPKLPSAYFLKKDRIATPAEDDWGSINQAWRILPLCNNDCARFAEMLPSCPSIPPKLKHMPTDCAGEKIAGALAESKEDSNSDELIWRPTSTSHDVGYGISVCQPECIFYIGTRRIPTVGHFYNGNLRPMRSSFYWNCIYFVLSCSASPNRTLNRSIL